MVPYILDDFNTSIKKQLFGLFSMAHFLLIYRVEYFNSFTLINTTIGDF